MPGCCHHGGSSRDIFCETGPPPGAGHDMTDQRVRGLDQEASHHGRERKAEVDDHEIKGYEAAERPCVPSSDLESRDSQRLDL